MASEILLIQLGLLISAFLFTSVLNLLVLWYLAGIYLVLLGLLLFLDDGDIFIGFLWVIDLGVGLIFFVFILHYATFLHQKQSVDKSSRLLTAIPLLVIVLYYIFFSILAPIDTSSTGGFSKTWVFYINWIDHYLVFNIPTVTDLNLLHEIYFINNNFEFILVNFFLFYGIISAILLAFLIKYIFTKLILAQFQSYPLSSTIMDLGFIRNQDFLAQQSASEGERVWVKKRKTNL